MSQQYPYIQTLYEIDAGVKAYAIQPISEEDETAVLPEENPILAFGPLGQINIFVGATNAGKSRFLRLLAKCESYRFYSRELHEAVSDLRTCSQWLAASEEGITFRINQQGAELTDRSPILFSTMPKWAKEALKGVQPKRDYNVTFNSDFFQKWIPLFEQFAADSIGKPSGKDGKISGDSGEIEIALWARNLMQGEEPARERDEEGKRQGKHYFRDDFESFTARKSQYLSFDVDTVSKAWRDIFLRLWGAFDYLRQMDAIATEKRPQRIYIPTLRSAVSLTDDVGKRLTYDVFEQTVRNNYFLRGGTLQVFTGNRLYDTLKRDRNGTPEVVARLRDFEQFVGASFFEGRNVEIVALDEAFGAGQHISVRVQGETPRELHHLGDGINTLIILLYQLFMAEPESWIFIEEPELNLHPGLQRVFLQTLIENEALQKRNLRVFFTTHSNHLLRMTLRDGTIAANDVSVFAFQQRATDKDRFFIRPLVSEHHAALALLGVQNASVLLAQCGIWVEGVTDRQYLRAYLKAYQNSAEFRNEKRRAMREDTHFAFWEYAGSNLAHYLMSDIPRKGTPAAEDYERGKKDVLAKIESSALCNRIFLVADRDENKDRKHKPLQALAEGRSNFVYYVTPCIEIENLLSPTEIAACLPHFFRKETIGQVTLTQKDYKDVRIGKFLSYTFPNDCPKNWVADSGTLETNQKNRLCELAVKDISWDSMSKEAKALAKLLHEFLVTHNVI